MAETTNNAEPDLSTFLELLIEITALQRLRHAWVDEAQRDTQWKMKFQMLHKMIEARCLQRDQLLELFAEEYPEIKNFAWLQEQGFDA